MSTIAKLLLTVVIAVLSLQANAQTAGDRLFAQGQKLQLKQTVSSQKQAIAKFSAAKKAYDSSTKKAMCDNQIAICRSNIKLITRKTRTVTKKETVVLEKADSAVPPEVAKDPVRLSLSVSSVEFKSSGKKSDNHEVMVNCNYDDWTYTFPEWVDVTKNGNKLTLTADPNKTDGERSGVLTVKCYDEKAELMIYQKKPFSLKSLIGGKK